MADIANSTIRLVAGFEGLETDAYLLGGIPHIGYGFTFYKSGWLISKFGRNTVKLGDKLTKADADQELEILLNDFGDYVTSVVKVTLNQNQFDALVSLCYNIGKAAFKNSTLLQKLNTGDYSGAAAEFDRWVYAGGVVNAGLVTRRRAEKNLFGGGGFTGGNMFLYAIIAFVIVKIFSNRE